MMLRWKLNKSNNQIVYLKRMLQTHIYYTVGGDDSTVVVVVVVAVVVATKHFGNKTKHIAFSLSLCV